MLRQYKFLTKLLEDLENPETTQRVIDDLNAVRSSLMTNERMSLHVTADWKRINELNINLNAPWDQLITEQSKKRERYI